MPTSHLIVLGLAFLAGDDDPKDVEFAKLQGTWQLTASTYRGKDEPAGTVAARQQVFEGGRATWIVWGKRNTSVRLHIDPAKTPAEMDCINERMAQPAGTTLAIYRLDGDDLVMCVGLAGEPRPTAFEAPVGSKRVLWTFKRIKAEQPGKAGDRKALDQAKLQASWHLRSALSGGKPVQFGTPMTLLIAGDRWHWLQGRELGGGQGARLEIDPTQTPPAIDVIPLTGPFQPQRYLGIYRLEGDSLTVCFGSPGDPRPVAFESKAGGKQSLYEFRRADP